jgi:hypothetical protein
MFGLQPADTAENIHHPRYQVSTTQGRRFCSIYGCTGAVPATRNHNNQALYPTRPWHIKAPLVQCVAPPCLCLPDVHGKCLGSRNSTQTGHASNYTHQQSPAKHQPTYTCHQTYNQNTNGVGRNANSCCY